MCVRDLAAFGLSVKGDELCLCAAWHSLRVLLLHLLLLLWATRGSNLTRVRREGKNRNTTEIAGCREK